MSYYDYPSFEVEITINNHSYSEIIESKENISSLRKQLSTVQKGDFTQIEKVFKSFSKDILPDILKENNTISFNVMWGDFNCSFDDVTDADEDGDIEISFKSGEFASIMDKLKNIGKTVFNDYLDFFVSQYEQ